MTTDQTTPAVKANLQTETEAEAVDVLLTRPLDNNVDIK